MRVGVDQELRRQKQQGLDPQGPQESHWRDLTLAFSSVGVLGVRKPWKFLQDV